MAYDDGGKHVLLFKVIAACGMLADVTTMTGFDLWQIEGWAPIQV